MIGPQRTGLPGLQGGPPITQADRDALASGGGINAQGQPVPAKGDAAPKNGLAAFANSPMGQMWSQAGQMYGPSQPAAYPQAFQGALDAARGSIHSMLSTSLADIANSQQKAGEALGQYAPQVNAAWQEGQGQIANAANASQGALARYGMDPGMSQANLEPERLAMQATHSGDLSDQKLLALGTQQMGAHDTAIANLAASDRMGQLDQLQAQLSQQAAMAAQAHQYDQQNQLQQFGLGMLSHAQDFKDQQALSKTNATADTRPATGRYQTSGLTEGQVLSAQKMPQYARYNSMIQNLTPGTPEADIAAGQILQATAGNPALQQVLMAENQTLFSSATKVADQTYKPASTIEDSPLYKLGSGMTQAGRGPLDPTSKQGWIDWLKPSWMK